MNKRDFLDKYFEDNFYDVGILTLIIYYEHNDTFKFLIDDGLGVDITFEEAKQLVNMTKNKIEFI